MAGGAVGGVAGGDGAGDDADHGQHAAHGAEQGGGDLVYHVARAAGGDGVGQAGHAVQQGAVVGVEGDAGGGPDQGDDALGHHGAVEDGAALLLAGDAAGHHGGLGGVEAGDGAAGNGDKHGGPYRSA